MADPILLDRLRLRRAALHQLSGLSPHALDELVEEHRGKMRQRLDAIVAEPAEPVETTDDVEPAGQ